MSLSKAEIQRLKNASEMLKSLAHPVRMLIIDLLKENGRLSVKEIQEALKIEQAVVSQHLAIMKKKDVLKHKKEGKHCIYFIKHPLIVRIVDNIKKCQDCL